MGELSRHRNRSRSGERRLGPRLAAAVLVWALVLTAGCSAPQRSTPSPVSAPAVLPGDAQKANPPGVVERAPVTAARDLLPAEDLSLTFAYQDGTESREVILAAPGRVVQAKADKAFLQWTLRDDGVWRPDLTGADRQTLLRFLPPQLVDGLTWEQFTDIDTVRFRLTSLPDCGSDALRLTNCWRVEVIHRVSVTTYDLAPGLGVVRAESKHRDAADSYEKVLTEWSVARLDAVTRDWMLEQGQALHDREPGLASVQEGNLDIQQYLDKWRAEPNCGTPAAGKPILPGASGQVAFLCADKLWSMDLATGKQTRLYTPGLPVHNFAMEPGGRGFAVSIPINGKGEVRYIDRDPAKPRLMFTEESWDVGLPLSWSPNGETLVISQGTSTSRVYHFIDRATGRNLGKTGGRELIWSPDGLRYALVKGEYVPNDGVEGGSSRTLLVGDVRNGQRSERVRAAGTAQAGYEPLYFAADGTLVYREFLPVRNTTLSYWALPPGAGVEPTRLTADSPLVTVGLRAASGKGPQVDGKSAHSLGNSPDGKWTLFIFNSYGEVYLIGASMSGSYVRLPGGYHQWIRP